MPTPLEDMRDWFARAALHIDPADLLHLSPIGVISTLFRVARRSPSLECAGIDDLAARDPEFVRLGVDLFRALGKHYFRWKTIGVEHVPRSGPALLVGSHNGGTICTDSALTLVAVWDRLGPSRAVYPLAHDLLFQNPATAKYAPRLGVLHAGHDAGQRALLAGHLVLVYPGGDLDSVRPFRDRYRIELGQRTGFLKLALRQRAPIVPVVSTGTHEQFVVLTRGDRLARLIGGKRRLRLNVFPIVLCLPWGLTSGYFPYLPLPAQTTVAFGPPIHFHEVEPAQAEDPEVLARCSAEVVQKMQGLMDQISAGRRAFLG